MSHQENQVGVYERDIVEAIESGCGNDAEAGSDIDQSDDDVEGGAKVRHIAGTLDSGLDATQIQSREKAPDQCRVHAPQRRCVESQGLWSEIQGTEGGSIRVLGIEVEIASGR